MTELDLGRLLGVPKEPCGCFVCTLQEHFEGLLARNPEEPKVVLATRANLLALAWSHGKEKPEIRA